jgi:S-adenosylmethionine:tRNA ribosyltransferase-isomerase
LLVVRSAGTPEFDDRTMHDLPQLLRAGDALVVNDSKVIPARLHGRRIGRASEPKIEATLHQRLDGSRWRAFVKPARRLAAGDLIRFGDEGRVCFLGQLDATVEDKGEGGEVTLSFAFHGPVLDQAIEERGDMPLPPYIAARRTPDERERLSDHVRHDGRLGRRADSRPAFHRRAGTAIGRARHRPSQGDAACRCRHFSPSQER